MNKIVSILFRVYVTKDGSRTTVKIHRKHSSHDYVIWGDSATRLQDAINDLLEADKIRCTYHFLGKNSVMIIWKMT